MRILRTAGMVAASLTALAIGAFAYPFVVWQIQKRQRSPR